MIDWTTEIRDKPCLDPRQYNFLPQQQGSSISAGSGRVIAMSPMPAGMVVGNSVYLSGGTGSAEVAPITAVGVSSITVTCANSHSGAWTVQSATSGIQECLQVAAATNSSVRIASGAYTVRDTLKIPTSMSVRGSGHSGIVGQGGGTAIVMASGFTGRAVQCIAPTPGYYLDFGDLSIIYTTNGASQEGLYVQEIVDGSVSNLWIVNSYDGLTGVSLGRFPIRDVMLFVKHNGYNFSSLPASAILPVCVPDIEGGVVNMTVGVGSVFHLAGTIAGMEITGVNSGLGANGFTVVSSTDTVNEVAVSNCTFDSYSGAGVLMVLTGTAAASRWKFNNCLFAGQFGSGNILGMQFSASGSASLLDLTISNCSINTDGPPNGGIINLQGVSGVAIDGNVMTSNTAGGTGIAITTAACHNVAIGLANQVGLGIARTTANGAAIGVFIDAQAHTEIKIGCAPYGSTVPVQCSGTGGAGSVVWQAPGVYAFANLPAASAALQGSTASVSDSTTNTWGATITGSGVNKVLAYCNGSAWTVAAK